MSQPVHMDLKKDRGLTIQWEDGASSYYSIAYLRRMSPSAEARQMREQMGKNRLMVLPSSGGKGPIVAVDAELVGNYAIKIKFSDGHETGLYTWKYLREIDPAGRAEGVGESKKQSARNEQPEGGGTERQERLI